MEQDVTVAFFVTHIPHKIFYLDEIEEGRMSRAWER